MGNFSAIRRPVLVEKSISHRQSNSLSPAAIKLRERGLPITSSTTTAIFYLNLHSFSFRKRTPHIVLGGFRGIDHFSLTV